MTAALHRDPTARTGHAMAAMSAPLSQTCAVRLIDRRTGQTHRINGNPLLMFTRSPDEAVADLLSGRDATLWEARVEPLGTGTGGRE